MRWNATLDGTVNQIRKEIYSLLRGPELSATTVDTNYACMHAENMTKKGQGHLSEKPDRGRVYNDRGVRHPMSLTSKGRVKEFLEGRSQSLHDVSEVMKRGAGPDHRPSFVAYLTFAGVTFRSNYHSTKKAATQEAYVGLLQYLQRQPNQPLQEDNSALAVKAMKGDAILRLILIDHFSAVNPGIDKGTLHRNCERYSTNAFLHDNYDRLERESLPHMEYNSTHLLLPHLSGLGPQLPLPTGGNQRDPTVFEAWIADRFDYNSECYMMTKYDVLPALGLKESSFQPRMNGVIQ